MYAFAWRHKDAAILVEQDSAFIWMFRIDISYIDGENTKLS